MANESYKDKKEDRDTYSSGASHPVGTAVGTAAGAAAGIAGAAAAGAATGSAVGPVGTVAGAIIGGVAGGLAGSAIAEQVNPEAEDAYWRENYRSRVYVEQDDTDYENYRPAYLYGVAAYSQYPDRDFDSIEPELRDDWEKIRGKSKLSWERAKFAVRDAFDRLFNRRQEYR